MIFCILVLSPLKTAVLVTIRPASEQKIYPQDKIQITHLKQQKHYLSKKWCVLFSLSSNLWTATEEELCYKVKLKKIIYTFLASPIKKYLAFLVILFNINLSVRVLPMELVTPRMINTPLEGEVTEYIEYVRLFIRSFTNSPLQRNLRWFLF